LQGESADAARKLQAALDQFKDARPLAIQAQADELANAKQDKSRSRAEKEKATRSPKPN